MESKAERRVGLVHIRSKLGSSSRSHSPVWLVLACLLLTFPTWV